MLERSYFRAKLMLIFKLKMPNVALLDYTCRFRNPSGEKFVVFGMYYILS
jgi:hypothetical protein